MMYSWEKEKNFINFTADGKEKPYKFDINTGLFYGMTDKPIKNYPKGFASWISDEYYSHSTLLSNVVYLIAMLRIYPHYFDVHYTVTADRLADFVEWFKVVDRLESIGFTNRQGYSRDNLQFVNKYFKHFVKYFRENPDCTISDFREVREKSLWIEEYKLSTNEYVTDEIINLLWQFKSYYPVDKTDVVAYYVTHGLYDFYDITPATSYWVGNRHYQMFEKIKQYFTLCEKLEYTPQKEDMMRSYVVLRRTYILNQQKIDAQAIAKQYASHPALTFENEDFKVIIPKNTEDFRKEAEAQQNCVYNLYLPKVLRGETNVVFIRPKDALDKSYITCEVSNSGEIIQYLARFNRPANEESAVIFRDEYKNHLLNNWV